MFTMKLRVECTIEFNPQFHGKHRYVPSNAGHVARMGEGREKPEGKRPLGRQKRRWEDNIKMDLQEVGGGID
jgi:hypothetical protein